MDADSQNGYLELVDTLYEDDTLTTSTITEQALELGLDQVCPRADITTAELVSTLHRHGFVVRCHGVYSEDLMRHVVDCGADGMTINFPDKLLEYIESIN